VTDLLHSCNCLRAPVESILFAAQLLPVALRPFLQIWRLVL
jgi:hypothetical protein